MAQVAAVVALLAPVAPVKADWVGVALKLVAAMENPNCNVSVSAACTPVVVRWSDEQGRPQCDKPAELTMKQSCQAFQCERCPLGNQGHAAGVT